MWMADAAKRGNAKHSRRDNKNSQIIRARHFPSLTRRDPPNPPTPRRGLLTQRIHGAVWMTAAAATAEFIRGAFARDFRLRCQALKVAGVRLFGHSPQRLRPCGLQAPGDAAEQI